MRLFGIEKILSALGHFFRPKVEGFFLFNGDEEDYRNIF
jgi:hypothetical protein